MTVRHALAALALAASPVALNAATLVPTNAAASSSYPGYGQASAIDTGANFQNTDWASNSQGAGSYIDLDLGALFRLTGAHVVDRVTSGGGNGSFSGGITDFTTSFSLQAISGLGGTLQGTAQIYNFGTPSGPTSYASFTHDVSLAPVAAQYVRYTVLATNGPNPGLSDISFAGNAVPEPAAWALMIGGFGVAGGMARRRRALAAA